MKLEDIYHDIEVWLLHYGVKVVFSVIVLFIGFWLIRVFGRWSQNRMHQKDVDPTLRPFFMSMLFIALRLLLIFAVIEILGIHLTIFAALVASFGVAAGLALSGTLQNFASGVLILLLKPFIVGDNIIAQGLEGTVTSIQIFYTTVRTFDNRTVILPNSKLSNEVIINISREGTRRLDILQKFAFTVDEKKVKEIVNKTIDNEVKILKTPERRIGVTQFDLDGFIVCISVWVNAHGFEDTKQALMEKLMEDIKGAGIKLTGMP